LKYYDNINVNEMKNNFYCGACLDILVGYYKVFANDTKIDRLLNYLRSFNLEDVLNTYNDIEQFKLVIRNAMDNIRDMPVGIIFNRVSTSI